MAEYSFYQVGNCKFLYYARHFNNRIPYIFSLASYKVNKGRNYFESKIVDIKTGLKIAGYSIDSIERKYYECIEEDLYYHYIDDFEDDEKKIVSFIRKNYPFKDYVNGVKKYFKLMKKYEEESDDLDEKLLNLSSYLAESPPENKVEERILDDLLEYNTTGFYGISYEVSNFDEFMFLYIFFETLKDDDLVIYDISAPFEWSFTYQEIEAAYSDLQKILIIVEGVNDKIVLDAFLNILYPQFAHLYDVVSFDGNIPGGSSYTRHYFNLLTNARVVNRIIAIFDNDAAGVKEMKLLSKKTYDCKYKFITLPEDSFFENYPTYFPNGKIVECDINGKAASIELYYPKELLMTKGNYEPIIWRGYEESLKQYHGVIKNKKKLNKRFKDLLNNKSFDNFDWTLGEKLLNSIFDVWK